MGATAGSPQPCSCCLGPALASPVYTNYSTYVGPEPILAPVGLGFGSVQGGCCGCCGSICLGCCSSTADSCCAPDPFRPAAGAVGCGRCCGCLATNIPSYSNTYAPYPAVVESGVMIAPTEQQLVQYVYSQGPPVIIPEQAVSPLSVVQPLTIPVAPSMQAILPQPPLLMQPPIATLPALMPAMVPPPMRPLSPNYSPSLGPNLFQTPILQPNQVLQPPIPQMIPQMIRPVSPAPIRVPQINPINPIPQLNNINRISPIRPNVSPINPRNLAPPAVLPPRIPMDFNRVRSPAYMGGRSVSPSPIMREPIISARNQSTQHRVMAAPLTKLTTSIITRGNGQMPSFPPIATTRSYDISR